MLATSPWNSWKNRSKKRVSKAPTRPHINRPRDPTGDTPRHIDIAGLLTPSGLNLVIGREKQALGQANSLLPDDAAMVRYLSPHGTLALVQRILKMLPAPAAKVDLPSYPSSPPIGWTVSMQGINVEIECVVPNQTIDALGEFVTAIKRERESR